MHRCHLLLMLGAVPLCLGQSCTSTDLIGQEVEGSRKDVIINTSIGVTDSGGGKVGGATVNVVSYRMNATTNAIDAATTIEVNRITNLYGEASDTRGYLFGDHERIVFVVHVNGPACQGEASASLEVAQAKAVYHQDTYTWSDEIENRMVIIRADVNQP